MISLSWNTSRTHETSDPPLEVLYTDAPFTIFLGLSEMDCIYNARKESLCYHEGSK